VDADEIQPLSAKTLARVLAANRATEGIPEDLGQRRQPRWPFPGAVELWLPGEGGTERHVLGACHNLSEGGVGVRVDQPLKVGLTVNLAVHQPELSLHGKGTVRHCSPRGKGYLAGLQFVFEDD
jgi:hypothetical protein